MIVLINVPNPLTVTLKLQTCQYPAGVPAGCTEVASSSTYDEVTVSSGDCYIIKSHA